MNDALPAFVEYVRHRYQDVLTIRLSDLSDGATGVAYWVDDDAGGWLLDSDVGIAMLVIPFEANKDLNESIQYALKTATSLQPKFGLAPEISDSSGYWHVSLLWLVSTRCADQWREAIAETRRDSGFSEEVGFDAVIAGDGESWLDSLERHGLPQLLLHVRKILRLTWRQMPTWLSANARVASVLEDLPSRISPDVQTVELAKGLVADALRQEAAIPDADWRDPEPVPEVLEEVEITNFRNIRHTVLTFPKDPHRVAQTHVIFGPNGSGKTSIFEALCLGLTGTSKSLERFQSDPDVGASSRDYSAEVLSPLRDSSSTASSPSISLNRETTTSASSKSGKGLDGSFLAQEDSQELLLSSSDDLGLKVLKGYSTLADRVSDLASEREKLAKHQKSEWLRVHGLNASITRRETRTQRLIESTLSKEDLTPPTALVDWLKTTAQFMSGIAGAASKLGDSWNSWHARQATVVDHIAHAISIGEPAAAREVLNAWLVARGDLLASSLVVVRNADPYIEGLRTELAEVSGELAKWAEWLSKQQTMHLPASKSEQSTLAREAQESRTKLADLRRTFDLTRRHSAHLSHLSTSFLQAWATTNPNHCPTCEADHEKAGGIAKVVLNLQQELERRLASLESDGKAQAKVLSDFEAKLASLGECPVPAERQVKLNELLEPFLEGEPLSAFLGDSHRRQVLTSRVERAKLLPSVPTAPDDSEINGRTIALVEEFAALDAEAERLWPLPERWSLIVTAIKRESDRIVADHLPNTLQRLWWEIALALTPARWNLPGTATFQLRGKGRLSLSLAERPNVPARYLFNQAEQHLMGLAWFFVRYLSYGRFQRAVIALDDAAQEMDQTTFRSFCRFIQSFERLHEKANKPTQLLFFLHQEDRALDIARATMGRFLVVTWQKSIQSRRGKGIWETRLLTDGFSPPNALRVLGARAKVS